MSVAKHPLKLIIIAAWLTSAVAGSASAWPFGKAKTPEASTPVPASVPAATQPEVSTYRKATSEQIQQTLRADPLTQAAFFGDQFQHEPTNAQIGLYLSNALRSLGRNAEAADIAHRVLLFAPDNRDVLIAAARAHIADNQAFYAVDPLKHAIELKPGDWQPYSLLGVAYDQIKRSDDAQAAWATALKLSPDNPAVLTNMAMSDVTRGDFAHAEPLLRQAVAQKGANLQIRQNLALVLGLQGKMAEAEKLLREDLPPQQADANLTWLQQALAARNAPAPAPASVASPTRSWDAVRSAGS